MLDSQGWATNHRVLLVRVDSELGRRMVLCTAGLLFACVAGNRAQSSANLTSAPITTEAVTSQPAAPTPVPLIEIDADAVAALADPPREPPPWNADTHARIVAVQAIVEAAATQHQVEPALINGLIWVESKFQPRARGPAGAQGLMQLMPKTATAMAKLLGRKRNSHDPDFNIHAGTLLLARLLDRFDGDVRLALAAYNRGSGTVANWVAAGQPLPEGTQAFVDRVLSAREWFTQPVVDSRP